MGLEELPKIDPKGKSGRFVLFGVVPAGTDYERRLESVLENCIYLRIGSLNGAHKGISMGFSQEFWKALGINLDELDNIEKYRRVMNASPLPYEFGGGDIIWNEQDKTIEFCGSSLTFGDYEPELLRMLAESELRDYTVKY